VKGLITTPHFTSALRQERCVRTPSAGLALLQHNMELSTDDTLQQRDIKHNHCRLLRAINYLTWLFLQFAAPDQMSVVKHVSCDEDTKSNCVRYDEL